jgi:hypothetical protein
MAEVKRGSIKARRLQGFFGDEPWAQEIMAITNKLVKTYTHTNQQTNQEMNKLPP